MDSAEPDAPMADLRAEAPLLDRYLKIRKDRGATFTIPGHKGRAGWLDPGLAELLDPDVPLFGGLDTMRLEHGLLAQAEERAAALWGADWCRFSSGGSSHSNQSACLMVADRGRHALVSRTAHKSVLFGLMLAGLTPVWIDTQVHPELGLPLGPDVAEVERVLATVPDVAVVVVTEPTYFGTLAGAAGVIEAAHRADVPVLVDQAWGAHFGRSASMPPDAISLGADLVCTSIHKTLLGFSQASVVMGRHDRLDRDRVDLAFEVGNTTSPAGAILASIDASRALLETTGPALLEALVERVGRFRDRLSAGLPQLRILTLDDPTKVLIKLEDVGADGFRVEGALAADGSGLEYVSKDAIIPLLTLVDRDQDLDLLADRLLAAIRAHRGRPRTSEGGAAWSGSPEQATDPRTALLGPSRRVQADAAVGEASAELIALYPPGTAVLAPGEKITREILDLLRKAQAQGSRVAYAADPTLATLRVVGRDSP